MTVQKINKIKEMNLRILAHDISVEFHDDRKGLPSNLAGQARMAQQKILIDNNAAIDSLYVTLIHETIHLIGFMNHLELSESQIESLGVGIFSLLRNNPHFLTMFQEQYSKEQI